MQYSMNVFIHMTKRENSDYVTILIVDFAGSRIVSSRIDLLISLNNLHLY